MILCDNTRCKIGWYHMKCLGLSQLERDALWKDHAEWYCEECRKLLREDRTKTTYGNGLFDDDTYGASDKCIQRANTVYKVWRKHQWPAKKKVLDAVRDLETQWEDMIPIDKLEETYNNELRCREILRDPSLYLAVRKSDGPFTYISTK
jgi:hypothetical protein